MASAPDYYISSDYSPYDDSSANGQQPQHNTTGDKFIVIAILIFFTVIFFLSTLHMYAKWLWRLRNRNPNFNGPRFQLAADDHHLQAAAGGGLTKAAIALLPTFTYNTAPAIPGAPTAQPDLPCKDLSTPLLECAVCLSEFQENEKGRTLPACKHSFHIECIDMWFYSHRTCPLCRTVVLADTVDKVSSAGCIPAGAELQYRGHGDAGAVEASSSEEDRPANEMRIAIDTIVPSPSTSAPSPSTAASSAALNSTTDAIGIIVPPSTQQQQASSSSTRHSSARHLPHITIEIPTRQDISMTSPGCTSLPMSAGGGSVNSPYVYWSCTPPQLDHSGSSHTPSLKSPSIRATLKKTLWSMQAASKGKSFMTSVAGISASPKDAARRLPL